MQSGSSSTQHVITQQDAPCVLVVDDDPLTQARLEHLIETTGLAAVSVPSAEKARAALGAVHFPIVIVDRMLEDGDGLELCGELRRQHSARRIYLIVLSALDSAGDIETGLAAGADVYMSKRSTDREFLERRDAARRSIPTLRS